MKKRIKILLIILMPIILITGGILMKLGTPFDIFLTKDFTKPTKIERIDYLKEHEEEMTNFVKKQNSKVTSVQWDWDSLKVETGGGPITSNTWISIEAKFNDIKDSSMMLQWPLRDEKSFPKISDMFLSQPLRIDGGTKFYE